MFHKKKTVFLLAGFLNARSIFILLFKLHLATSIYLTICNVEIFNMTVQYNKMVTLITALIIMIFRTSLQCCHFVVI
jgi:hypothetical protein